MIPLTNEQQEPHEKAKNLLILQKKKFVYKYTNEKKYHQVRDHCHYRGK